MSVDSAPSLRCHSGCASPDLESQSPVTTSSAVFSERPTESHYVDWAPAYIQFFRLPNVFRSLLCHICAEGALARACPGVVESIHPILSVPDSELIGGEPADRASLSFDMCNRILRIPGIHGYVFYLLYQLARRGVVHTSNMYLLTLACILLAAKISGDEPFSPRGAALQLMCGSNSSNEWVSKWARWIGQADFLIAHTIDYRVSPTTTDMADFSEFVRLAGLDAPAWE